MTTNFYDIYCLKADSSSIEPYSKSLLRKICKLCNLTSDQVSFSNKPHLVPELLGRNNLSSNFECDSCNDKLALYESALATFIAPFPTLLNLRTKKGVPIFKSRKNGNQKSTAIYIEDGSRKIYLENVEDFKIDRVLKEATLIVRRQKANPFYIYRSLARIGLLLMPEEDLKNYKEFSDWIIDKNQSFNNAPLLVARNMLTDKYYEVPSAQLYKIKDEVVIGNIKSQYVLILRTANLIFQLPYPMYVGVDPSAKFCLDLLPDVLLYNKMGNYRLFNLSHNSSELDEEIRFSFEN